MATLHVSGHVRKVGSALAVLIPVKEARKAGLTAGDPVDVDIRSAIPDSFGLLADLPYRRFDRSKDLLWRDRI